MKKFIAIFLLGVVLSVSVSMIYAENLNQADMSKIYNDKAYQVKKEKLRFKRFLEMLKSWGIDTKKITEEDRALMENLYIETMILEKNMKLEEASIKWNTFGKIYSKYDKFEDIRLGNRTPSFKEYLEIELMYTRSTTVKKITEEDFASMKTLYHESMTINKYEIEANKAWESLSMVLKKYYPELNRNSLESKFHSIRELDKIPSFKEYIRSNTVKSNSLKKISKEDLDFMEKLYNESISLNKKHKEYEKYKEYENYENNEEYGYGSESVRKWLQYKKILYKYYPELSVNELKTMPRGKWYEIPSFRKYIKYMEEIRTKISEKDLASVEPIYNEAVDLLKKEKWKEAGKKWEEFEDSWFKVFEKYPYIKK